MQAVHPIVADVHPRQPPHRFQAFQPFNMFRTITRRGHFHSPKFVISTGTKPLPPAKSCFYYSTSVRIPQSKPISYVQFSSPLAPVIAKHGSLTISHRFTVQGYDMTVAVPSSVEFMPGTMLPEIGRNIIDTNQRLGKYNRREQSDT
jgi:hypothetical protein